ncbi:NAD(P)-binding protein [Amniculicola lignicola CBS 123094]|uniref:NAD(P)-binding protein n=1 Tax=Amniculicola lignicola CBS 123094 TaxID=1392246 RepID=A0A6A5W742_9PLEO|nr:NAD(P)-binding protein [Amniculicola lignicola CBS 123094]
MAHPNRLQNAHVLIFGGTSGIGFGVASMALSHGAYVVISGSRQPKVDAQVAVLQSLYPLLSPNHVSGYACDLNDSEKMESNLTALFDKATEKGAKKLDHIVHCAGDLNHMMKLEEASVEGAMAAFRMRYASIILIGKLLVSERYMTKSNTSSVTLTGGSLSEKPVPGMGLVAGGAAANEGIMRGLAVELQPLRVNLVRPGVIKTPLVQPMIDALGPEGIQKALKFMSLTGDMGYPEDIAEAYGWLMKDRFATGAIADCTGGRVLAGPGFSGE